jgi:hypothetical protein
MFGIYKPPKIQNKANQSTAKSDWNWTLTVMLLGLFIGLFSILYVGGKTMIEKLVLLRIFLFCSLFWFVVPIKYYCMWFKITTVNVFMLGIMGLGPLLVSFLLWTNYAFGTFNPPIQVKVVDYFQVYGAFSSVLFVLENDFLDEFPEMRRFEIYQGDRIIGAKSIQYEMVDGLYGYPVVHNKTPIF